MTSTNGPKGACFVISSFCICGSLASEVGCSKSRHWDGAWGSRNPSERKGEKAELGREESQTSMEALQSFRQSSPTGSSRVRNACQSVPCTILGLDDPVLYTFVIYPQITQEGVIWSKEVLRSKAGLQVAARQRLPANCTPWGGDAEGQLHVFTSDWVPVSPGLFLSLHT